MEGAKKSLSNFFIHRLPLQEQERSSYLFCFLQY